MLPKHPSDQSNTFLTMVQQLMLNNSFKIGTQHRPRIKTEEDSWSVVGCASTEPTNTSYPITTHTPNSNWKTDETRPRPRKRKNLKLGAKRSTGKFTGKVPGKFTGDNPAIDLNPALDSVGPSIHTDVRVCPSAHTGRLWLSVRTHRTSGCPSVHISARWPFPWTVRVILAHVGCLFSTHRTSVGVRQHTHDVRGLSISTRISTLALPVDCLGDFGPRGLSVQYTQDVCGYPSAHTGRPRTVRVCPCVSVCVRVSVSTHRTSVAVRQHTQDVHGLSISIHISTLALPVDCSGDFGPRGLSVQYTQDIRGCPSAHTGCPCTVRVCPCVRQHTQDVRGRPSAHTGRPWTVHHTHRTSVAVLQHTQDVRQHTQDVRGCPSGHTGRPWLAISTRPWLAHQYTYQHAGTVRGLPISTYISMLTTHISMLALPVDCPCTDFGQLMHHVSTHISMLVLPMDCPCTEFGQLMHQVSTYISMLALPVDCPCTDFGQLMHHVSTHISMLALPVDCPCTDFGQLMHHVSTHISMLALPVNCSCTDLDMSSSFDGLDCPSPVNIFPWYDRGQAYTWASVLKGCFWVLMLPPGCFWPRLVHMRAAFHRPI
ncbi:hypothetical protein IGI04_019621 [Brassica rapa subsp. trilocularis]|uniref:Uncharacterized protein n=1 Tax=Brassica rapa subsp. trilocularis TaxID=1813537 RepID=A0ABQ7MGD1_BRACM|nr:hypothetical protein IGI04_019621 [Brassica rapa subsp. trilocularis]